MPNVKRREKIRITPIFLSQMMESGKATDETGNPGSEWWQILERIMLFSWKGLQNSPLPPLPHLPFPSTSAPLPFSPVHEPENMGYNPIGKSEADFRLYRNCLSCLFLRQLSRRQKLSYLGSLFPASLIPPSGRSLSKYPYLPPHTHVLTHTHISPTPILLLTSGRSSLF